jgi:PilZ domain
MGRVEEKRKSVRGAYEHPIQFDLNFAGAQGLKSIEHEGMSIDICEHGLGLATGYPLKKDDVLRLHLPLNSAKITLPVFARVAWAKLENNRFRAGVEFLE